MSREFDVIVYGASGFTGRLVAEYMGNAYGTSVSWAMAGRSEAKLAEVRELIGVSADIPLVTADAANEDSLRNMVKRASCICTTCLLYTSPSPRDLSTSRMPSSA